MNEGITMAQFCQLTSYPSTLTTVQFEFFTDSPICIEIKDAHLNNEPLNQVMDNLVNQHEVPSKFRYQLFAKLRARRNVATYQDRVKCVHVRCLAIAASNGYLLQMVEELTEELITIIQILPSNSNEIIQVKTAALKALSYVDIENVLEQAGISFFDITLPDLIETTFEQLIGLANPQFMPFHLELMKLLQVYIKKIKGKEFLKLCFILY